MNSLQHLRLFLLAAVIGCSASAPEELDPNKVAADSEALLGVGLYFDSIVVFDQRSNVTRLNTLSRPYKTFRVLPMARVLLSAAELTQVSGWSEVRSVTHNKRVQLLNREGRQMTRSEEVRVALGYDGSGVEVAVIDTGADGTHPDIDDPLRHNWEVIGNFVDDADNDGILTSITPNGIDLSTALTDAALPVGIATNTDEYGHGTHVIGTIAGSGEASNGEQRGMAPGATVDSYSTSAGIAVVWPLEAYDHVIDRVTRGLADIRVISNSWGASGCTFDPHDPVNVASRIAAEAGILSVFAYGNDGPSHATCNPYAMAPYVLGIGATDKSYVITGFSSRGIPAENNDREAALANLANYLASTEAQQAAWDHQAQPIALFRPSMVAPGAGIVSAQNPAHAMTLSGTNYGAADGTSMATPHVSGVAALVIDAYDSNHPGSRLQPIDLIRLLEVTANKLVMNLWDTHEAGAGFVDARAAVDRAIAGDIPAQVTDDDLVHLDFPPNTVVSSTPISGQVTINSWETNSGYVVHDIAVPNGAALVKGTISWAFNQERIYLTLYRPGADATDVTQATVSSAGLLDEVNTRFVEVRFPEAGTWRLRVDGRINLGTTSYTGTTEVWSPAP